MGWTNSQFDGTLVIPTGATTGQRIVIDGTTGTITGYDANNFVVFTITPGGGFSTFAPSNEMDPARDGQLSSAQLSLRVHVPSVPDANVIATSLFTQLGTFPFGEEHITTTLQSGYTFGHDAPFIRLGSSSPDFPRQVEISTDEMTIAVTQNVGIMGGGFTIEGVDQGRGLREFQAIQANSATTTTTEIATITTDSVTFRAGRAYEVEYHGLLLSSVAGDIVRSRVWRGSIGGGGVSLVDSINTYSIPIANQQVLMDMTQKCVNATGSDITTTLIGTVLRTSGTGNVQMIANANNPAWIEIRDIGLAADYPNARAV